jgi:prolyl-tRNA synthetase
MGVPMEQGAFVAHVQGLLSEVQAALLSEAAAFRDANIVDVSSYDELKAAVAEGEPPPQRGAGT